MDQNNQPQQPSNEPVTPPQPPQSSQQAQQPAQTQYNNENPGQTLGIVSIILSFIGFALIGLILGIISRNKSKQAGASTTLGTVGMWLGIVGTVLGFLAFVLLIVTSVAGIQNAANEQNGTYESSISE